MFSVFTYKRLNVGHGMPRVDGVAGGWLRTAGFSSVIIAEQQQSDDPTLVYGTLRVGSRSGCESWSRRYGKVPRSERYASRPDIICRLFEEIESLEDF